MSLTAKVNELNQLVINKKLVEGVERFYADSCAMVESGGEPMVGKSANVERERLFENGLTKWNARLLSSAVDEATGTALNEWILDYEHSDWGAGSMKQVAVQKWQDGRVVHEAFYKL